MSWGERIYLGALLLQQVSYHVELAIEYRFGQAHERISRSL